MKSEHKRCDNLIPTNKRSMEEVRANSRKGGIKSGETRRKLKSIKQILTYIDNQTVPDEQALTIKQFFNIDNPTFRETVFATLYSQILKGEIKAIELYLKLKGELPKDIELKGSKSLTIVWHEQRYETDEETE